MMKKIRNSLAFFVANIFIFLGMTRRAIENSLKEHCILSIYFHNPSKDEFLFVVKWLKKNGFVFICMGDLKRIIEEKIEFPKGAVFISVDDGWASNFDNMLSIAESEKVPLTFFLTSDAIESGNFWFSYAKEAEKDGLGFPSSQNLKKIPNHERVQFIESIKEKIFLPRNAMNVEQVKLLSKSPYIEIGAHTHNHPILPTCTDEEMIFELSFSKNLIETWISKKIDSFAYPNGDFGKREIKALESLGFSLGFSNDPTILRPDNIKERFEIPRIGFLEGASKEENICRILGVWHQKTFKIF